MPGREVLSEKGQRRRTWPWKGASQARASAGTFVQLAELLELADKHPHTTATLVVGRGPMFSAGANIKTVAQLKNKTSSEILSEIGAKNLCLVHLFTSHRKLLVVGLNGPVIGLTASLVALADLVYAQNHKVFMSFPFTNIGLTTECAAAVSLPERLGLSTALEHVLLAKPLSAAKLHALGLVNRVFDLDDCDQFNEQLTKMLNKELVGLDRESIFVNKRLMRHTFDTQVRAQALQETMSGVADWTANKPQTAFDEIVAGKRRHKL
ncbi:hypothetical protein KL905_001642 [Ogataea polymorpha]|nr:hypothetical protein KL905_001642 [Ogataea polymorpha]